MRIQSGFLISNCCKIICRFQALCKWIWFSLPCVCSAMPQWQSNNIVGKQFKVVAVFNFIRTKDIRGSKLEIILVRIPQIMGLWMVWNISWCSKAELYFHNYLLTWQHLMSCPPKGMSTIVQISTLTLPAESIPDKISELVFVWISEILDPNEIWNKLTNATIKTKIFCIFLGLGSDRN